MNDVAVSKRNVPKQLIIRNDKFQFSSNINALQSTDSIESDCEIQVKKSEDAETAEINLDNFQIETKSTNISDDMTVMELDRLLRSDSAFFLIDTRCVRTFRNGHIIGAELFNCSSRIMTTKAKTDWDRSKRQRVIYQKVVLYNQRGEKTAHIIDFIDYIMNDCASISFVTGGYEKYVRHFPHGPIESSIREEKVDNHNYELTNETNQSSPVFNAPLSEILPFLFIGNEMDSLDIQILLKEKITHILNVTTDVPFYHKDLFVYKRLPAIDCMKQDMRLFYNEAIKFIDEARSQNGRVLVHCWAGVSRSVTIVAAYLLKHTRLNVMQTVKFIKSKRSIAEPNFSFVGQLVRYHSDLQQGIESRSELPAFANLENEIAHQFACELDDVCDGNNNNNNNNQSLLSRSTCSTSYTKPRTHCNFIQ